MGRRACGGPICSTIAWHDAAPGSAEKCFPRAIQEACADYPAGGQRGACLTTEACPQGRLLGSLGCPDPADPRAVGLTSCLADANQRECQYNEQLYNRPILTHAIK